MKITLIFLLVFSFNSLAVQLEAVFNYSYGAWELPATSESIRWVVIHNLNTAKEEQLFHVEVLSRKNVDAVWQVVRVKKHLAITHNALLKDLVKPTKGKVHPDPFIGQYTKWQQSSEKFICKTSLLQCVK